MEDEDVEAEDEPIWTGQCRTCEWRGRAYQTQEAALEECRAHEAVMVSRLEHVHLTVVLAPETDDPDRYWENSPSHARAQDFSDQLLDLVHFSGVITLNPRTGEVEVSFSVDEFAVLIDRLRKAEPGA
jgi:hypothetical protein